MDLLNETAKHSFILANGMLVAVALCVPIILFCGGVLAVRALKRRSLRQPEPRAAVDALSAGPQHLENIVIYTGIFEHQSALYGPIVAPKWTEEGTERIRAELPKFDA